MFVLYLVLCIGSLTTIYPFLLMASGAMRGPTDANDASIVPKFWSTVEANDPKTGKLVPESLLAKYLSDKYSGDISSIEATRNTPEASPEQLEAYEKYLESLPTDHWTAGFRTAPNQVTSRLSKAYQDWLRTRFQTIDELNEAYIEENTAFQTVQPPSEMLERKSWVAPNNKKYQDWLTFKATLPAEFRIPIRTQRLYQEFLRAKFENKLETVPSELKQQATAFENIPLPSQNTPIFEKFLKTWVPTRLGDTLPEVALEKATGLKDFPIAAYEKHYLNKNRDTITKEFTWRNYAYIIDYVALHGRALWNTVIFCGLAILTQLIINPLAAYALSRYPMKHTGKILLFLLATMAFPAEVAMIPSFLLLKDLGLLNTFAALVLPGAASGYMIFLLKGFFDSLPQELFESGQIDGAKELTLLWKIALPLSKPVLGYLALTAFMAAYGAFMYAFLVAQDQRIWTLMVFIYQLQNSAPKPVMLAALTVAAIPTLLVFLAAQKVIMKGIILPGEK